MASKNHKPEKCKEHKFELRIFGKVKKNVCTICGLKQDIPKEKKGKSSKVETPKKKSILSVILQYLDDKTDSFTSDDVLKWIKKNHPDMTYNDKSIGLHLRALCIGAKSNPSINKFASLNYSKEAKTFQKV